MLMQSQHRLETPLGPLLRATAIDPVHNNSSHAQLRRTHDRINHERQCSSGTRELPGSQWTNLASTTAQVWAAGPGWACETHIVGTTTTWRVFRAVTCSQQVSVALRDMLSFQV